jgi:hypothetical protein
MANPLCQPSFFNPSTKDCSPTQLLKLYCTITQKTHFNYSSFCDHCSYLIIIFQICVTQLYSSTSLQGSNVQLMHSWNTFGARTSNEQLGLIRLTIARTWGETITFPLIVYFAPLHEAHIQMTFCPRTPKWES